MRVSSWSAKSIALGPGEASWRKGVVQRNFFMRGNQEAERIMRGNQEAERKAGQVAGEILNNRMILLLCS